MADEPTISGRIGEFLRDVTTLDVLTLTGDIQLTNEHTKTPEGEGNEEKRVFQWDTLFKEVSEKMVAAGQNKLEVVAYTHSEWDCDSVNYVKSGPNGADSKLIESHNKAVEAAHSSRFAALQSIRNAL